MGRAETVNAIGEGEYRCDYLYNVELIEFESERLKLRKIELEETKIPEAEVEVENKRVETLEKSQELNDLLKRFRGEVNPQVLVDLTTGQTALESAEALTGDVQARRVSAYLALAASVNAFPFFPPPDDVANAYNAVVLVVEDLGTSLANEQRAINDALRATTEALNKASGTLPDPEQVRNLITVAEDMIRAMLVVSSGG